MRKKRNSKRELVIGHALTVTILTSPLEFNVIGARLVKKSQKKKDLIY